MHTREDWLRLGERIATRVDYLGLQQADVQARGGPSPAKLRALIHGRADVLRTSLRRGLETALEWAPGTIDTILTGTDQPGANQPQLRDVDIDILLSEIRRRVVSVGAGNQTKAPLSAHLGRPPDDHWVEEHSPRIGQG